MPKQDKPQPESGTAKVRQGKTKRGRKGMCLEARPLLEPDAGGMAIGAREIFVAVPPDPAELAKLRDPHIKASQETICKSLKGKLAAGTSFHAATVAADVPALPGTDCRL